MVSYILGYSAANVVVVPVDLYCTAVVVLFASYYTAYHLHPCWFEIAPCHSVVAGQYWVVVGTVGDLHPLLNLEGQRVQVLESLMDVQVVNYLQFVTAFGYLIGPALLLLLLSCLCWQDLLYWCVCEQAVKIPVEGFYPLDENEV